MSYEVIVRCRREGGCCKGSEPYRHQVAEPRSVSELKAPAGCLRVDTLDGATVIYPIINIEKLVIVERPKSEGEAK